MKTCKQYIEDFINLVLFVRCGNVLMVQCKQYVEMLEKNILAPYKFIHENATFYFYFNYAKVDDCLPQILQLLRAATLPTAEQNAMVLSIIITFTITWKNEIIILLLLYRLWLLCIRDNLEYHLIHHGWKIYMNK